MATLYEFKGVYYISCYFKGRRYRRSTGCRTARAAKIAVAECEERIQRGEHPFESGPVGFDELVSSYLEYCERFNALRTVYIKRIYCQRFAGHFGKIPINIIDRGDLERYLRSRNGAGATTVNREYATLRNMLNYAVDRGWLKASPANRIKLLPEEHRPPRILTGEELSCYFDWCRENDPLLYDLSTVAFNTALRPSDILKIRGEDVDTANASLCVRVKKLRGKLKFLPLNKAALEVLSRRKGEYGDFLFPGRYDGAQTDFKRRFNRAIRATGIEGFTFGQFRHNCAMALRRRGVDIYTLKELLGHASVTTTEAAYLPIEPDRQREAVNLLDERS